MFETSFPELMLVAIIGLLVLGPQRLPKIAAEIGKWVGRARRTATQLRRQLEREVELADLEEKPPPPPPPTPPAPATPTAGEVPPGPGTHADRPEAGEVPPGPGTHSDPPETGEASAPSAASEPARSVERTPPS